MENSLLSCSAKQIFAGVFLALTDTCDCLLYVSEKYVFFYISNLVSCLQGPKQATGLEQFKIPNQNLKYVLGVYLDK